MTEVCSCCTTISGHRSRPRPPIVIGQPMKTRKGTSHTLIRGPGGRQNYFKPKWHYLVLAASGAYDQDVWDVYGCNFSWRSQWHRRPWPTSADGDIANLYPSTPHLHGVLVLVTGNKFNAGVVVTGNKFYTGINDTGDHWTSVTEKNCRCRWQRR